MGYQQEKYRFLKVVSYTNSNYTRDFEDIKSITGYCFFLKRVVTTQFNKHQKTISTSISKAKYVVMSHKARKRVQIRRFLNKLLLKQAIRKMKILGDNKTSFILTRNSNNENRTKHIDRMHYYMQSLIEKREL